MVVSELPGRLPSRCFGGEDPGNHSGLSATAHVRTVDLGANFLHVSPQGTSDLDVVVITCICAALTSGDYGKLFREHARCTLAGYLNQIIYRFFCFTPLVDLINRLADGSS